MSDLITLTTTLNRCALPAADQVQLIYLLVELMPSPADVAVRMPLNIGLVLDQSGSMKDGDKLGQLKQAVKYMVDQLADDDYLSIVTFSGEATLVLPSTQVGRLMRNDLKRRIDAIDLKWTGTDIAPAIALGRAEVKKRLAKERVNRLLMLTDGQVYLEGGNHSRGERACLAEADRCGKDGIPLLALGLGSDWNEALLSDMAARSGGQADYIARAGDLTPFFAEVVQTMQAAAVQNAAFNLRLTAGIAPRKIWRVVPVISDLGYNPLSDRAISLGLGDLERGVGQALLVELAVSPKAPSNYRIAQAEVSYDVPVQGKVGEKVKADIVLQVTADPALARQCDARVMNVIERVTAFKLQTRALEDAQAGNLAGAQQKLANAVTMLLSQGEADLAHQLQAEAERLAQGQQVSSEGRKTIQFTSRKTVRLS